MGGPAPRSMTVDALTLCNACDLDPMHDGCEAGYCHGCCPAHGTGTEVGA